MGSFMRTVLALFFILLLPGMAISAEYRAYLDSLEEVRKSSGEEIFIGFNENAQVKCGDGAALYAYKKPGGIIEDCWLCSFYQKKEKLRDAIADFRSGISARELFIKKMDVIEVDPEAGVEDLGLLKSFIVKIGTEVNGIKRDLKEAEEDLEYAENIMARGAPARSPWYADTGGCDQVEVVYRGFAWNLVNSLSLQNDKGQAGIIAAMKNRTGHDLEGDTIYLISARRSEAIKLPVFNPWVIRVRKPAAKYQLSRLTEKAAAIDAYSPREMEMGDANESVRREKAFVYRLDNVEIPSDGNTYEKELVSEAIDFREKLIVMPYKDLRVYRRISFTPPFEIAKGPWRVNYGRESYTRVYPDVVKGRVELAAGYDREVIVQRKEDVGFADRDGLFGSNKRLKRAYIISLSNISGEEKNIEIIDRAPISADERVEVRNITVNGKMYKTDDELKGGIKLRKTLKPGASQKVRIEFEVVFDKDLNVSL